jgi:hypothetical protein
MINYDNDRVDKNEDFRVAFKYAENLNTSISGRELQSKMKLEKDA